MPFPLVRGRLALRRGDLPVDLGLLSEMGLPPSRDSGLGTLATLDLALLRGPFAFVREPLALIGGALPLICLALALARDPVARVRTVLAPGGGRFAQLLGVELPGGLGQLPALGLPLSRAPRLAAIATLQLAPFRAPLALICEPLALVGPEIPRLRQPLALVRDPLTLVRDPLALVRQTLALVDGRRALLQAISSPLDGLGQVLAPQREPLTLLGKLLPLLGDVLALRRNSLTFPSYPNELVLLARRLLRPATARCDFIVLISVRMHPDRTSFGRTQAYSPTADRRAACRCPTSLRRSRP